MSFPYSLFPDDPQLNMLKRKEEQSDIDYTDEIEWKEDQDDSRTGMDE